MRRFRPPLLPTLALAAASGVISALALPNELFLYGSPLLGAIALVPLYLAMRESRSWGAAALAAALFGALAHGLSSYWLWNFKDFRFWTLGSTTLAYALLYALAGLYLRLAARKGGRLAPLFFALVWTSWEHLKSTGFLGYPWGLIAYSWNTVLPLIQVADLGGLGGLTFMLAYLNGALGALLGLRAPKAPVPVELGARPRPGPIGSLLQALAILRPKLAGGAAEARSNTAARALAFGHLAFALLLGLLAVLYGFIRMARPIPEVARIEAILVQQNTDSWTSSERQTLQALTRLSEAALAKAPGGVDLIVFSETSLDRPYDDFMRFYERNPPERPLVPLIRDSGAWLFTGAPDILDYETFEASNAVVLIDPEGRQVAQYAKSHPVPFAEAIPFWDVPWFRSFIQEVVGLQSGWVMGSEQTIFEFPLRSGTVVRFGAPICFEDAFSGLNRDFIRAGADFLLNLTNDSWSLTASSEVQHFVAARFRAVETRRTLVRSTNSGLSAVVDPFGRILDSYPLFVEEARRVDIPVYRDASPSVFLIAGDWIAGLALFLSACLTLILGVEATQRGRRRA